MSSFRQADPPECSVQQCGSPHYARGFCKRHWRQWKDGKDPIALANRCCRWCHERFPITARPDTAFCSLSCKMKYHRYAPSGAYAPAKVLANRGGCAVNQCHNPVHANGFCQLYNNRFRRHSDPLYARERQTPSCCLVEDCGNSAFALGYCQKHYANLYRHGDPRYAETRSKEWQQRRRHPLHTRYLAILTRCYNPKAANFPNYGGRGIRVCDQWLQSFWTFVDDVGVPEDPTLQLHRIDNDGPYEPGNIEWVTVAANSRMRRSTVLTQSMADAIREERITGMTIAVIAAGHGVSIATVHSVLAGTRWKHGKARDLRVRRLDRSGVDSRLDAKEILNIRDHPLFSTYAGIKARVTNPKKANYPNYGARGIRVHSPWLASARRFIEDVENEIGPRPTKAHSLDRVDNDGHYEPGNIRWANPSQQMKNRSRKS